MASKINRDIFQLPKSTCIVRKSTEFVSYNTKTEYFGKKSSLPCVKTKFTIRFENI